MKVTKEEFIDFHLNDFLEMNNLVIDGNLQQEKITPEILKALA